MRCLGRLVLLFLLLVAGAGAWLYRVEITRYVRGIVDPMSLARRTGTPSPDNLQRAEQKVALLVREAPDSVILSAGELASLVERGSELLGVSGVDSISIELGDRSMRVRTMLDTSKLPERYRRLIPGDPQPWEEVIATGRLQPGRPGQAEWELQSVIVRGLPLPSDLISRALGQVTGQSSDGRLIINLPPDIHGFRVRPEGVAIYRSAP